MRSSVKIAVLAGVLTLVAVRPDADAALSPYPVATQAAADRLPGLFDSPYGDPMAGSFVPRSLAPSLLAEPPVAMIAPKAGSPASGPALPRELMSPDRVDTMSVMTAIQVFVPTEPPPAAPPVVELGKFTNGNKVARAPAANERPTVMRRSAMRHDARDAGEENARRNIVAIEFDGPSGAPFAHTRFCLKYPEECRVHKFQFRGGPVKLTPALYQELVRVNHEVNRAIVATNMNEPVAQEKWLIGPKFGDCNDYAVTKRHKLIARGWPARSLLLAEVVTSWGEHHLVLVVRTSQGDLVADNLDKSIRAWTSPRYRWVRIESPVNPLFWSKVKTPDPEVVAMAETGSRN